MSHLSMKSRGLCLLGSPTGPVLCHMASLILVRNPVESNNCPDLSSGKGNVLAGVN